MKPFYLSLLLLFISCSDDDDTIDYATLDIEGVWILTEMSGNAPNTTTTGDDMEWLETYSFANSGTFIKTRMRNVETIEVDGTYEVKRNDSEPESIELTFSSENQIIGNCTGDNLEVLYYNADNQLESDWKACDGPGLVYSKAMIEYPTL